MDDKTTLKQECQHALLPVTDALDALNGRWKLLILIVLADGPKRFKQISKEVHKISDKILSRELKELETNQLITRTVFETFPPRVEYALTKHAETLGSLVKELKNWGLLHRKKIMEG